MKNIATLLSILIAAPFAFAQTNQAPAKASLAIYGVKPIPALEKKMKIGRAHV